MSAKFENFSTLHSDVILLSVIFLKIQSLALQHCITKLYRAWRMLLSLDNKGCTHFFADFKLPKFIISGIW